MLNTHIRLKIKSYLTSVPQIKLYHLGNLIPRLKADVDKVEESLRISIKSTSDFSKLSLIFKLIEQSMLSRKSLEIEYESLETGLTTRRVDPYSLIFRRHAWYLIGFCHLREQIRVFRLNRIKKVALLDKTFEMKPDFSLSTFFKDSWEIYQGEPAMVKIRFKGIGAKVVESGQHHPSEKISKSKDGSLLYEVKVGGIEEISRWILGFGENAEVLEPKELREKMKSTIKNLSKIYWETERMHGS